MTITLWILIVLLASSIDSCDDQCVENIYSEGEQMKNDIKTRKETSFPDFLTNPKVDFMARVVAVVLIFSQSLILFIALKAELYEYDYWHRKHTSRRSLKSTEMSLKVEDLGGKKLTNPKLHVTRKKNLVPQYQEVLFIPTDESTLAKWQLEKLLNKEMEIQKSRYKKAMHTSKGSTVNEEKKLPEKPERPLKKGQQNAKRTALQLRRPSAKPKKMKQEKKYVPTEAEKKEQAEWKASVAARTAKMLQMDLKNEKPRHDSFETANSGRERKKDRRDRTWETMESNTCQESPHSRNPLIRSKETTSFFSKESRSPFMARKAQKSKESPSMGLLRKMEERQHRSNEQKTQKKSEERTAAAVKERSMPASLQKTQRSCDESETTTVTKTTQDVLQARKLAKKKFNQPGQDFHVNALRQMELELSDGLVDKTMKKSRKRRRREAMELSEKQKQLRRKERMKRNTLSSEHRTS